MPHARPRPLRPLLRCFALLLACLMLCASVVANINDVSEHFSHISAELLPDAKVMEHLESHDHIIALTNDVPGETTALCPQRTRVARTAAAHSPLLFCSIDHPPEFLRARG